jgi:hypothetical protein
MTSDLPDNVKVLQGAFRILSAFGFNYRHEINCMSTLCRSLSKTINAMSRLVAKLNKNRKFNARILSFGTSARHFCKTTYCGLIKRNSGQCYVGTR